jgi:TPP-dependent pyruvate/acetoin dehydrogenase alpha subunit
VSQLGDLRDPTYFTEPLNIANGSADIALELLHSMKRIRSVEEMIGLLVESQEARCPCHLAIGQEAAAVGVCSLLRPSDAIFGAHRSHGHYLALGGSSKALFAEVLGKRDGCSGGFGGSMHLRSPEHGLVGTVPIVGATIPIALGAALSAKRARRGDVAIAFFGDGAAEEGVFHESLNLASSMQLPSVFVIENNLFASHLHIDERQPHDRVSRYAVAHGIDSLSMDGNDVLAVREEFSTILKRVRGDSGPFVLELVTYRHRGHVGHRDDQDVGVARSGDLPSWMQRDPIRRLELGLLSADPDLGAVIAGIDAQIAAEVNEALRFGRESTYPDHRSLASTVMYSGGEA